MNEYTSHSNQEDGNQYLILSNDHKIIYVGTKNK